MAAKALHSLKLCLNFQKKECRIIRGRSGRESKRPITVRRRLSNFHTVEVDWSTGAPVPVKGTEQVRPCELVLIAMGFLGPEQELLKQLTLDVDGRSNILAKEEDHKTSLRGVFAAGDCRRGQSLVVWAIREGRQAADAVDKFLMK